ncbi:ATP-binding cassette sub-family A member 2-like [Rhopilema esculentum]|uniref:ATP-binding cassette sub-family A member 2-like n=1 Tax=Rhopilema esculentum TaxID=499914 RepID=UPI0031D91B26
MGFLLQLRLLLWKNYILKKRSLMLVLFEILIPLVLFKILMGIRLHRPPYSSNESHFNAKAMPSAGVLPLLQSFCPNANENVNKHGYTEFPKASKKIKSLLGHIADIYNSSEMEGIKAIQHLHSDLKDLTQNADLSSDSIRNIRDFRLARVLRKPNEVRKFLVTNFSMSEDLADILLESKMNGTEISRFLLEKQFKETIQTLLSHKEDQKTRLTKLRNAVILQYMFDKESLLNGPTWMKIVASSLFPYNSLNRTSMQRIFTDSFLSSTSFQNKSCMLEFEKLLVFGNASSKQRAEIQRTLCKLDDRQSDLLLKALKDSINYTALFDAVHFHGNSLVHYRDKIFAIQKSLQSLGNLESIIRTYSDISRDFKFNMSEILQSSNSSHSQQLMTHARVIWRALGSTICGSDTKKKADNNGDGNSEFIFEGGPSITALKFALYVLTNDPKILYAPNGTQADLVVSKASHLLTLVKRSREFAKKWLKTSQMIKSKLSSNSTQELLRTTLQYSRRYPHFLRDWTANVTRLLDHEPTADKTILTFNRTLLKYLNESQARLNNIVQDLLVDKSGSSKLMQRMALVDRAATAWIALLKPLKLDIFYGFPTEQALTDYYLNSSKKQNFQKFVYSAVLFDNIKPNGMLPSHVTYRIRMDGQLMPSTRKIRSRHWYPGPNQNHVNYYQRGFVWLQDQLERAISEVIVGHNITSPGLYIQEMPYPCYLKDDFMFVIQYMMPLCITVSFIYSVAILVQNIVYEKEQRLKEVMKMMGLSNAVHWTAWFITSTCLMTVIVMLMTIILKYGGILKYSNPFVIWLFLTLSSIATTLFCFLLSVFFSKAKLAAACGGIIYFLTYMPYVLISIREGAHVNVDSAWKSLASLFSTTAFGLGARYFALYEQDGKGLQWKNIPESPLLNDEFSLGNVFAMLIVDTFLYGILTWYIEHVFPGSYGLPRPWYFPFQISYWIGADPKTCSASINCKRFYSRMSSLDAESTSPEPSGLLAMDAEPVHLPLGVVIEDLVKVYDSRKKAVDHLSLNLYEGQITSFLGHNGAGKTTTMSILTGLFPPTSGTAHVYGHDIRSDMDKIRTSLGMCPQHNVLFESLTLEEHLWFYARLKGMSEAEVGPEMDRILEDLGLPEKRHSKVESLSGGMKRKLSVAMAFVGGSRTVILDEPTAGVDPYARRAIWDLLVKYKEGRTILLSTHFMDEADLLGDRIAIISCGKLRCCGSSLFLKNQFGDGYHLTLVKDNKRESSLDSSLPSSPPDKSRTAFDQDITKYIRGYVPSAQLICETRHELSFILPKTASGNASFKSLFADLESNKIKLGFSGFGLTDTSLEEVFLKVTEASIQDDQGQNDMVGEVTVTLPAVQQNTVPRNADSGIELDSLSTLTPAACEASLKSTCDAIDNPSNKKAPRRSHQRSLSSDFFRDSKSTPVVTCVHRKNPCGRVCGHRRALSSDFRLDKVLPLDETKDERIKPIKRVLFGHRRNPSNTSQASIDSTILEFDAEETVQAKTAFDRRFQQFCGLFLKRFHHSRRNFKGLISQIFLPAIFVCIAMTVAMSRPGYEEQPKLILSPTMIRPLPNVIPFNNEGNSEIARKMEATLRIPSGIGADCVLKYRNCTFESLAQLFNQNEGYRLGVYDQLCEMQLAKFQMKTFDKEKLRNQQFSRIRWKNVNEKKCKCTKDKRNYECDPGVEGNPNRIVTVTGDTLLNITGRNMEKYLLYTTEHFRRHRYGGLTFGEERKMVPENFEDLPNDDIKRLFSRHAAKAWFNNKGYHALPVYLNSLSNTVLRSYIRKDMGNPASYGITATYHPFSLAKNALTQDYVKQGTDVVIAIFVIIAMSFVPASFVIFLVTERVTKAKHLQFVSGAEPVIYWLVNFIWDMCNYLIPATACMLILYLFQLPAYASATNFPAVCCLFLMYGWSITPLMYPAAFVFKEASTAYVVLIVVNLFVGVTFTVTVFILQLFPDDPELSLAYDILRNLALVFPNYCLGRGLMDLAFTEYSNEYYKLVGEFDKLRSPFEWNLISRNLVFMAIEGFVFFSFTLMIEYLSTCKKRKICVETESNDGDEDVVAEHERVLSGDADDDLLRMENLTKVYQSKKTGNHHAVSGLCLGVSRGECFGLLGVNGAGKTSTFKMLTGDTSVTAGDAFILNKSVVSDTMKVHKMIGYCPQFDALIDELTAEEHLGLYSRLRGIPEANVKKVSEWAINKLALGRYASKPSKSYSGGNKRKLSAAIALIGNPPLIFMDEPTTGMDPGARRFLWNLILSIIRKGNRSVVLTSHSMEECEALCTRLVIMVNGKFKCLGSTQHLKNKFGEGYMVALRAKGDSPNLEPMKTFFEEAFPDAVLKECHHNMLEYQIHGSSRISLSDIFAALENSEASVNIEDFSVSQTTLENVFINFAKEQMDRSEGREKDSEPASLIQRLRHFGRAIRNTFANRPDVHFSSLWTPGARNQMQCESFMEDDDTISIQFPGSDVHLELLQDA